jgi:hypothetical protein
MSEAAYEPQALRHLFVSIGMRSIAFGDHYEMVELVGIEPTTPCLQSRCSPS